MRAVINAPGRADRVTIASELPEPTPEPGEVLVAVEAFSLNRGELALLGARDEGWRPGQDVAGTVVAAAADGSGPPEGTRVVGLVEEAGWAERVAVPVVRLAPIPPGVDAAAAATLGIAGRTALRTVELCGTLLGRRVLVTGAAGGLGRFQVQLAALAGASVVAVTRRSEAAGELLSRGASAVVSRTAEAEGSFDVVLEGVGGRGLAAAIGKVAPDGTVVLVGASDAEPSPVGLTDFLGHENAVIRTYFSYAQPSTVDRDLATLLALLADGRLTADLGVCTSWTDVGSALERLAAGQVQGKAVLLVD